MEFGQKLLNYGECASWYGGQAELLILYCIMNMSTDKGPIKEKQER